MTHLTTELLLELREPGLEPGLDAARAHLAACETCQAELRLIDQRVARLRALATPRPGRDHFLEIRSQYVAERRRKRVRWAGIGGLAVAASAALIVMASDRHPGGRADGLNIGPAYAVAPDGDTDLAAVMAHSQELEEALRVYDPDSRMIDARTATIAARIEDQLTTVDRQIELIGAIGRTVPERQAERLRLWNERVGLLNALMDVHLTRATYAGM